MSWFPTIALNDDGAPALKPAIPRDRETDFRVGAPCPTASLIAPHALLGVGLDEHLCVR